MTYEKMYEEQIIKAAKKVDNDLDNIEEIADKYSVDVLDLECQVLGK